MGTNEKGFSIIGIIISAGVVSGLAITLSGFVRDQDTIQRKTESYFEISNLSYLILRTLENDKACTQTLGPGTKIVNNIQWSSIKNRNGEIILDKSKKYGNELIEIQSMTPKNIQIQGTTGEMDLQVVFKKMDTVESINNKIIKKFPLSIDVDGFRKLVNCRSNSRNIASMAKERMCRMMDGIFEPANEECNLDYLLLKGQKQICSGINGVFKKNPPHCDMEPFVLETVKEICKSVQGKYDVLTGKCALPAPSISGDGKESELLKFNALYPVCRIGFGVGISPKSTEKYGASTFSTCFGAEVGKLFKTIKSEDDIKIRTAPWKSYWLQYDGNGVMEQINFYRKPDVPYEDYRNQIYFVDGDPSKGLRKMYRLINVQIRMKYAATGRWHTFTFAVGINYPASTADDPDSWKRAEQNLEARGKGLLFDDTWLSPWTH